MGRLDSFGLPFSLLRFLEISNRTNNDVEERPFKAA